LTTESGSGLVTECFAPEASRRLVYLSAGGGSAEIEIWPGWCVLRINGRLIAKAGDRDMLIRTAKQAGCTAIRMS